MGTGIYPPGGSGSWSERRRLIRFRRKKEHLHFSEELKLVPKWLFFGMAALLVVAETVALNMVSHAFPEPWPPSLEYGQGPGLAIMAGIVFGLWAVLATVVCLTGYVYVDAKRRGMNAALWVFLVLILLPAYLAIGFVIYFTAREPMPYHCPKCGTMVSARFNYCSSCRYLLHPTCGHCQREVGELDKFCPHCGTDVAPSAA